MPDLPGPDVGGLIQQVGQGLTRFATGMSQRQRTLAQQQREFLDGEANFQAETHIAQAEAAVEQFNANLVGDPDDKEWLTRWMEMEGQVREASSAAMADLPQAQRLYDQRMITVFGDQRASVTQLAREQAVERWKFASTTRAINRADDGDPEALRAGITADVGSGTITAEEGRTRLERYEPIAIANRALRFLQAGSPEDGLKLLDQQEFLDAWDLTPDLADNLRTELRQELNVARATANRERTIRHREGEASMAEAFNDYFLRPDSQTISGMLSQIAELAERDMLANPKQWTKDIMALTKAGGPAMPPSTFQGQRQATLSLRTAPGVDQYLTDIFAQAQLPPSHADYLNHKDWKQLSEQAEKWFDHPQFQMAFDNLSSSYETLREEAEGRPQEQARLEQEEAASLMRLINADRTGLIDPENPEEFVKLAQTERAIAAGEAIRTRNAVGRFLGLGPEAPGEPQFNEAERQELLTEATAGAPTIETRLGAAQVTTAGLVLPRQPRAATRAGRQGGVVERTTVGNRTFEIDRAAGTVTVVLGRGGRGAQFQLITAPDGTDYAVQVDRGVAINIATGARGRATVIEDNMVTLDF